MALAGLTSGFGMGPGVAPPLWRPSHCVHLCASLRARVGCGMQGCESECEHMVVHGCARLCTVCVHGLCVVCVKSSAY